MQAHQYKPLDVNEGLADHENEILRARKKGAIRDRYSRLETLPSDFTLVDQYGEFVTLSDTLEAKPVVINFQSIIDNPITSDNELISLNQRLSEFSIQHFVISHDQAFLNLLHKRSECLNLKLLHDQHLSVFMKYGLVETEISTPFELFEDNHITQHSPTLHVNAMYLIGMNRRILFSQLNFSNQSIYEQALIDEIDLLRQFSGINSNYVPH